MPPRWSQRGHEEYRAARGRSDLPRVSEGAGAGGGDREPYQRTVGAVRSETEKEGLERAMEESRRPGCTHHEDEGWTHASGAQGRTCGRPVERRSAGYHAAAGQ